MHGGAPGSGAPKGNQNARKGTEWKEAIVYALKNYQDDNVGRGGALKAIAKKMIHQAIEGDQVARKEIGERLDGKAVQALDVDSKHWFPDEIIIRHVGIDDEPSDSE